MGTSSTKAAQNAAAKPTTAMGKSAAAAAKGVATGTQPTKAEKTASAPAKPAKAPKPSAELITLKPEAFSLEVGPAAVKDIAKQSNDENKISEALKDLDKRRYDTQSNLVMAILKAAAADDTINLNDAFSGDKKKQTKLNDQLGLALGIRHRHDITTGAGDSAVTVQKIEYAPAVASYFPTSKDAKGSPEWAKKNSTRANFLTTLKGCTQTAAGIMAMKAEAKHEEDTGTLRLTGPGVAKVFGYEDVLLDNRQTVKDEKGEITLKERPNFKAVASIGAAKSGNAGAVKRGSNTRGADAPANGENKETATAVTAFLNMCKNLVLAVPRIDVPPSAAMLAAIKSVYNAFDARFGEYVDDVPGEEEQANSAA